MDRKMNPISAATLADLVAEVEPYAPPAQPGRRTFEVVSCSYQHTRLSRVGLTLEVVLAEALAQADDREDRSVWEILDTGARLRAVILTAPGRDPVVLRLDVERSPAEGIRPC